MTLAPPAAAAATIGSWWRREAQAIPGWTSTHVPDVAAALMAALVRDGALELTLPGGGHTRSRFDALVALGELDLTVGRLAEAHTDALAILAELGHHSVGDSADSVWAVWAAEPPSARVEATTTGDAQWCLDGRKAWCSGAGGSTHALVTAHADDGARLFAVDLRQPGVAPLGDPWPTSALSGTDTRSVMFAGAAAFAVGEPGDYVGRPGFWHGSVGVAAGWYGGAVSVARALLRASEDRALSEINLAHLGAVGSVLAGARAALNAAADAFDDDPTDESRRAQITARTTRAVVEAAATEVVDRIGRALGAAPLALDGAHARRVADLQLYVRQSHADRDLADLGRRMVEVGELW
jgi:hypothetical protein